MQGLLGPSFEVTLAPGYRGSRSGTFRPRRAAPPRSLGPVGTETSLPELGQEPEGQAPSAPHTRRTSSPCSYWMTSSRHAPSGEQPAGTVTSCQVTGEGLEVSLPSVHLAVSSEKSQLPSQFTHKILFKNSKTKNPQK